MSVHEAPSISWPLVLPRSATGMSVCCAVRRALEYMESSDIAGVQFRSVPVADPGYCGANRRLAESIGAFHAFLAPAARFGWMPFIGHNALLRTSAVRRVGGFTPGFFSDDLDLTVRLNLAGYRIRYAAR